MEETKKAKVRSTNLEILRIVSMILILLHHFYDNNIILDYQNITIHQLIVQILSIGGKIGVNCFMLITGYFMIESKFKIKKLLQLMGQVWFYSVIGLIAYAIIINGSIETRTILRCLFPISYGDWWFITTYIIIYILSNYINQLIKSISKRSFIFLIGFLLIIWSVIPSVLNTGISFSNFDWLLLIYLLGAYIRLYVNTSTIDTKKVVIVLFIFIILSIGTIIGLDKLYYFLRFDPLYFALYQHQILPVSISICLFIIFLNYKCNNNKVIHLPYIVLYEISTIILIYFIGALIECIRQNTIEKLYMKLLDKIQEQYKKYRKKKQWLMG